MNDDPEFSFKVKKTELKETNYKPEKLDDKTRKLSVDYKDIESEDSPRFNTGNNNNDSNKDFNKNDINKNVDYQIKINNFEFDVPQNNDLNNKIKSENKKSEIYFSNNQVYHNKDEIEHAKKSHFEYLKMMKENKDPLGVQSRGGYKIYSLSEVAKHNKPDDLWMVIHGEVFDLTLYLDYHPGGAKKLMLGAGKDATDLFNEHHPWVNFHSLVGKLKIGTLK